MDPITTALVPGLAVPIAKDMISDGYEVLKTTLKKKFGKDSDVVDAVEKLEETTDQDDLQKTLEAEVKIAKVDNEPEIFKLDEEPAITSKYSIKFEGEVKGAQVGDRISQGK